LRVILPKKGRLCTAFAAVLDEAGLRLDKQSSRHDFGVLHGDDMPPIEALTMRNSDALRTLAAGAADMAVVGLDMLHEFNAASHGALNDCTIEPLGLAPCALYIAAPVTKIVNTPRALDGCRIATSFPGILQAWLARHEVQNITIVECEGGVEDMIRLGLADVICDLVETGGTLAANGLQKIMKVMDSEAVLVSRPQTRNRQDQATLQRVSQKLCAAIAGPIAVPA
jgi:ATP phosphoribosyltransferase